MTSREKLHALAQALGSHVKVAERLGCVTAKGQPNTTYWRWLRDGVQNTQARVLIDILHKEMIKI